MVSKTALVELRMRGDVLWENQRYESVYVVDRPELTARLADYVPVLHLGQVQAIEAIVSATRDARWLVVYVWSPRDITAKRFTARGDTDGADRLRAWDETEPLPAAHLKIDTSTLAAADAADAAEEIHRHASMLST